MEVSCCKVFQSGGIWPDGLVGEGHAGELHGAVRREVHAHDGVGVSIGQAGGEVSDAIVEIFVEQERIGFVADVASAHKDATGLRKAV